MVALQSLERFMRLLHDVERVKRVARRPDEREMTNTAEHTFELALVCWYIIAVNKLNLDLEKVLRYALAHDVIEAYAGDTPAYDKEMQKTKAAREHAALERIEKEFPEFQDFTSVIHEYESRATPEARFVYATDKIVDPVNASMEETQSIWKEFNISLETLVAHKNPKVALSEHVVPLWDELVRKLETKRGFFFHS